MENMLQEQIDGCVLVKEAEGMDKNQNGREGGIMIEESERKKEYLQEYHGHVRRINRIEEEIKELRNMKTTISINYDGMPRSSKKSDLSEYASRLDELERKLLEEKYLRISAYKAIADQINMLKSESEKDVLFYRYIRALNWWEIAEKMNYSERWVQKIHGKALAHLELPKEFIEIRSNL